MPASFPPPGDRSLHADMLPRNLQLRHICFAWSNRNSRHINRASIPPSSGNCKFNTEPFHGVAVIVVVAAAGGGVVVVVVWRGVVAVAVACVGRRSGRRERAEEGEGLHLTAHCAEGPQNRHLFPSVRK